MQTKTSAGLQFTGHDQTRSIDNDRLTRALTQEMGVAIRDDPLAYEITHQGSTYDVDVDTGTCTCGDYQHRGKTTVCKHVLKAAFTHVFRTIRNPELVVRVLDRFDEVSCIHGSTRCNGPVALPDEGPIPCPDCTAAVPDEWTVWCRLHDRKLDVDAELAHAGPIALTDGGENDGDGDSTNRWDDSETVIDADGDEVPRRTERADFGGGESTGVDEL